MYSDMYCVVAQGKRYCALLSAIGCLTCQTTSKTIKMAVRCQQLLLNIMFRYEGYCDRRPRSLMNQVWVVMRRRRCGLVSCLLLNSPDSSDSSFTRL